MTGEQLTIEQRRRFTALRDRLPHRLGYTHPGEIRDADSLIGYLEGWLRHFERVEAKAAPTRRAEYAAAVALRGARGDVARMVNALDELDRLAAEIHAELDQ